MGDAPVVSVIIPAHDAADTIAETMRSVLSQSWARIEPILVDDGSTDETGEIVRDIGKDAVRVIRQEQRGAAAARNVGLNSATGSYVQFLDADDILSATKIELQMRALEFAGSRSIASCTWTHFEHDPAHAVHRPETVWTIEDPVEWLVRSLSGEGMMQPGAWLTPRSVIDDAGPWNESLSLHDDGEFFHRVLLCADRNIFVPDAIVYYRTVSGSLSRRRSREAITSAFAVCQARQRLLLMVRDDAAARRAIATQYAQFAYEFAESAPDLSREALTLIRELRTEPAHTVGGSAFRLLSSSLGFAKALRIRSALK
jgi:glycosyltransferase involved in cell wall biosynthesis